MKIKFLLFSILFGNFNLFAQPTFEKTFGTIDDDMGCSVSICNDGTYIISGYVANIYTGYEDLYLARIDMNGDTMWTHTEGIPYGYDSGEDVIQTFDGGFAVTGYTTVADEFVPFLAKFNGSGNKLWSDEFSQYISSGMAYALVESPDSGIVICGTSDYYDEKNTLWNRKAHLIKTNKTGGYLWDNTYGGYGVHYTTDICNAGDNGFVICGEYDTPGEYTAGWMFKTGSTGILYWQVMYGSDSDINYAWRMAKTPDGGYIFVGTVFYGIIAMNGDIYVVKTDGLGAEQWSKTFGGPDDERGACVAVTSDGGYLICGSTGSVGSGGTDIWMIRTDANGDTLWTRTHGGPNEERAYAVHETYDGGFVFCGYTNSMGLGGTDIYLFKTNMYGLLTNVQEPVELENSIRISPNPGNGMYTIYNLPLNSQYVVHNLSGSIVARENADSSNEQLDLTGFPDGIYLLNIHAGSQMSAFKIIKK